MSGGDSHVTDCGEVLAEVFLYLDGEITVARHDLIHEHLEECSPCLRKYGVEQEVRALVARCCGGDRAPQELRARVLGRLQEVVIETTVVEYRVD